MNDQGLEDAAILLMSLGEVDASEVFRHLTPTEVERLGETITKMQSVSHERVEGVLDRFTATLSEQCTLVPDRNAYLKAVLHRALGDDRAQLLIDRIMQGSYVSGIEGLKWMDAAAVAELLRNEHPQIVAAILVHLENAQSAAAVKLLPEPQRNEVMARIATLDTIQPSALRELNEVMSQVLSGSGSVHNTNSRGGIKKAAQLVTLLGDAIQSEVLGYIGESDEILLQQIRDCMFTFDDLMKLDSRGIQMLLKEVQSDSLVVALKGATPRLREKFIGSMSKRAGEALREDLETRGPVRISEVEATQKELVKVVLQLAEDGQIMLGGGDDQFV